MMDELTAAERAALREAWDGPTGVVLVRGREVERWTAPESVIKAPVSRGLLAWRKQPPGHWPAAKLTEEGYAVACAVTRKDRRADSD